MTLGERLKRRRIELNMTQEELASRVEMTKAAISHYETGRRIPRPNQLTAITTVLDLPAYEFDLQKAREARKVQEIRVGEPIITVDYFPGSDAVFDEELPEEETALEQLKCILRVIDQGKHSVEQGRDPLIVMRGIEDMISAFLQQYSALIAKLNRALSDTETAKAKYNAAREKIRREGRARVATAENFPLEAWEKLNRKGQSETIKRIKELCRLSEYVIEQLAEDDLPIEALKSPQSD